ncbi:MAG: glycoside hydrolase family 5 protein [Lachnospiraceae bacterium]
MKKKAMAAALLSLAILTGVFAGCGNKNGQETAPTPTDTAPTGTAVVTDKPEPAKEPEQTQEDVLKGMTALEVVHMMGNGINLGNTMEAYGRSKYGVGAAASSYETCWGQPVTTKEMISAMKAEGFDTLRVPVAWTNAIFYEDGDYTIQQSYLDRVGEIIDYALEADMFVIVNDHWDGGWWGMFGSANEETRETAMELYTEMWRQIAEEYADRSYKLIFESANEELGNRLNDKDVCPDSGSLSQDECYETANRINQAFVDTVRAAGGNNADRFLLIAGINTNIADTCDARFQMPKDTAKEKLLLSVHYYDPSNYCIFESVANWGSRQEYEYQNETLKQLTKFTEQGIGVVIGEWGVLFENGAMKENMALYMENFLNNCDLYGYCPVLWDCSNLFNRRQCKVVQEYEGYFKNRSYEAQLSMTQAELKAEAEKKLAGAMEAAPEAKALADDEAVAWIMYTSSDWAVSYSVGDTYAPDSATAGLVATDVPITGAGTYTVSLDLTGTAAGCGNGMTFAALGIGNGEKLFPGYIINIIEVKINGEKVTLNGLPYTTSDDGLCTRVNLYNAWVTALPEEARTMFGRASYCTPTPLDITNLGEIRTIEVTFNYVKK